MEADKILDWINEHKIEGDKVLVTDNGIITRVDFIGKIELDRLKDARIKESKEKAR